MHVKRLDITEMEYNEIEVIKQSEKVTVSLVQGQDEEQVFVQKVLHGKYPIYKMLKDCSHPCLPKVYEVIIGEDTTTIIEEYIDGKTPDSTIFSEKQFLSLVKDLCGVLGYLHGKGIIHRDIKPSNLIMAKDGHIRLIDFDAARTLKEGLEQDTRLLGTRGYAAPEQYGFAQTDERTDIYSLGVTLELLLGESFQKPYYKKILRKCRDLDPNKRYQSVKEVETAFFHPKKKRLTAGAAVLVLAFILGAVFYSVAVSDSIHKENTELTVLPVPANPHWDGETGILLWDNVPESGYEDEVQYDWKLYRKDTPVAPKPGEDGWCAAGDMRGDNLESAVFDMSFTPFFEGNGYYYVAVAATGDGIRYADSPFVISDGFAYTGEDAPPLPAPTDLAWRMVEQTDENGRSERLFYATWSNLDAYEDTDMFDVWVYDKDGNYVMNNIWPKESVLYWGMNGIRIRKEFLSEQGGGYRFTVQALSSRPNEFKNSPMPDPIPEEYYSPWYWN